MKIESYSEFLAALETEKVLKKMSDAVDTLRLEEENEVNYYAARLNVLRNINQFVEDLSQNRDRQTNIRSDQQVKPE